MQKSGINVEEDPQPQPPRIQAELRDANLKTRMADFITRRGTAEAHEVQLPRREDILQSIESLFLFSNRAQPSKKINAGATIADFTSLEAAIASKNLFVLSGAIASEIIATIKNDKDTGHYSELKKSEKKYLKGCKSQIVSALKSKLLDAGNERQKKEIKKLIKETKELFPEIEKRSKQGLNTELGSRLEAFIGSSAALVWNNFYPFKTAVDVTSDLFTSFVRVLLPYSPDPALIDIAVRTGWFIAVSALATIIADEIHRALPKPIINRDYAKDELKGRVNRLFEKIQKVE